MTIPGTDQPRKALPSLMDLNLPWSTTGGPAAATSASTNQTTAQPSRKSKVKDKKREAEEVMSFLYGVDPGQPDPHLVSPDFRDCLAITGHSPSVGLLQLGRFLLSPGLVTNSIFFCFLFVNTH